MNMLTYIESFYLTKSSLFSSDVKRNETIYGGSKITGTTTPGEGEGRSVGGALWVSGLCGTPLNPFAFCAFDTCLSGEGGGHISAWGELWLCIFTWWLHAWAP